MVGLVCSRHSAVPSTWCLLPDHASSRRLLVGDITSIRTYNPDDTCVATLVNGVASWITGMAVNGSGLLHVSLANDCILTMSSDGKDMELLCGAPGIRGYVDGEPMEARFNEPNGMAFDSMQSLLVLPPFTPPPPSPLPIPQP